MQRFTQHLSRLAAALVALAVVTAGLAAPASADTMPTEPGLPTTVSADALPTVQVDGVVWSQVIVGNTVYAAGSFSTARPAGAAPGVSTTPRTNLLAYDIRTGNLITSWAPTTNAQVLTIAASPDGSRIYIGGDFTQANGSTVWRIAALDAQTGALIPSFAPRADSKVRAIVATGSTVYFGGLFSAVGSNQRPRLAAANAANGAVLPWAPAAVGGSGVNAMVMSPDGSQLVVGGSFTTLNGSSNPGYGLGAVDPATGDLLPFAPNNLIRNGGPNASIMSLSADADAVYGSGYVFGSGGNLEGVFSADWADGSINWVNDCHGDTYSAAPVGDVVYMASHQHYCGNIGAFPQTEPWTFYLATANTKEATGTVTRDPYGYFNFEGNPAPTMLNWFPVLDTGTYTGLNQGPWHVTGNSQYVLMGGEFRRANGVGQQGLVRYAVPSIAPNDQGPVLTGAKIDLTVGSYQAGTARIRWTTNHDRDNKNLTYTLIRNSNQVSPVFEEVQASTFWERPAMGFIDRGLTPGVEYRYRLKVTDPFGNFVWSDTQYVTITADTGSSSEYVDDVLALDPSYYWRLGESGGSKAIDWAGWSDANVGAGVTRGAAGAILGDADTATVFNGSPESIAVSPMSEQPSDTFTVETWINTTSTSGGKILGFGNNPTGNSGSYDRHVYMDNSGRIWFGVYPGGVRTVNSSASFNDGQWHHVVASLGSNGMRLYVDGRRVGARTDVTSGQAYAGYWRIGGDNLGGWPSRPANDYFQGAIDDVAVYPTVLAQTTVLDHYTASGRTSELPPRPVDAYGAAVYDLMPDLYWRVGESSGTTAADSGISGNPGEYRSGYTLGSEGALTGVSNTAVTFDGVSGLLSSAAQANNPRTYSEELWFRTSTTTGGKLIGFGNNATGLSSNYDRHVYMENDGRLTFGVWTGFTNTITSTAAYNDDQWHHMVATQSSTTGMALYVDGVLVGTNGQTEAQDYVGYWKVGADNNWGSQPYFAGSIDEVAIYSEALTAEQIAWHHQLGIGNPNMAPTAAFTPTVTNLDVSVDGSASSDPDGALQTWAWDFGDGTTATGALASHSYAAAGTYTITLTVTDDGGASGTTTQDVTVAPAPNVAPTAAFTWSASELTASFDGTGSTDSDGSVVGYAWAFGDGGTSTEPTPTHAYAVPGTYEVTLVVTDDEGATGTVSQDVQVDLTPNVAPTAAFTSSVAELTVSVDGSSSTDSDGAVAGYAWDFGDGASDTGATTSHTYAAAGTYTVTLTVTDDEGATGTVAHDVTVADAPPAGVLATDAFGRSVTGGWGTADAGGPWSLVGAGTYFRVADGSGRMTIPRAGGGLTAYLGGVSSTQTDASVEVSLDKVPNGGGGFASLVGRRVSGVGDYRAKVKIASNGAVTAYLTRVVGSTETTLSSAVVPGLTYAAGEVLHLRTQVTGTAPTTLQMKVWEDGTTEPAAWTRVATDATAGLQAAGGVGLVTYLSGSTTNFPVDFRFDDLNVVDPSGAPVPNVAPVAEFTSSVSELAVSVDGTPSSDSDGSVTGYAWDFGDGATGSGATASHTYAAAGTYTVTLTVTDDDGATGAIAHDVTVSTAPPAGVLAADGFARTVTGSWGAAEAGGPWSLLGPASSFAVADGVGRMTIPRAGGGVTAYLAGVASTQADAAVTVSLDKVANGGGAFVSLVGRRVEGAGEYRAKVKVASNGVVTAYMSRLSGGSEATLASGVVPGVSYAAGEVLHIRTQVTGTAPTTLQMKVWEDGTTEPAAWTLVTTDGTAAMQAPGGIALVTYVSGSTTNFPVAFRFDDLDVREVAAP